MCVMVLLMMVECRWLMCIFLVRFGEDRLIIMCCVGFVLCMLRCLLVRVWLRLVVS